MSKKAVLAALDNVEHGRERKRQNKRAVDTHLVPFFTELQQAVRDDVDLFNQGKGVHGPLEMEEGPTLEFYVATRTKPEAALVVKVDIQAEAYIFTYPKPRSTPGGTIRIVADEDGPNDAKMVLNGKDIQLDDLVDLLLAPIFKAVR